MYAEKTFSSLIARMLKTCVLDVVMVALPEFLLESLSLSLSCSRYASINRCTVVVSCIAATSTRSNQGKAS
jgi:hypothetical protein